MTEGWLFGEERVELGPGAVLLRGFASGRGEALMAAVRALAERAALRHMEVRGGGTIGVAMLNCGALGWVSDRSGYRYDALDPLTGEPWPAMPDAFRALAVEAAAAAGFGGYRPDACLVNRYAPGTRLGLHRDAEEEDRVSPIVSVSLGLPARFAWGGVRRGDPVRRIELRHGDVAVWGGKSRGVFHGVDRVGAGEHPLTGAARFNLTFRKVR